MSPITEPNLLPPDDLGQAPIDMFASAPDSPTPSTGYPTTMPPEK